ncbi:MAG: serine hydrolase domain-containing protein [Taibaiella sp.]|jgi:CubicO group peptidase (beta-lactamase class C family)
MKKHFILLKPLAALMLIAGLFASCKKDNIKKAPSTKVFKTEIFKEELIKQLTSARGYGFVITQNGQIAQTHEAGIGSIQRSDTIPFSINSFINIASVTKTLTATTFIQFMRYRDITIDSTIGKWLPDSWPQNEQIRNITFKQLLTHTSGIRSSSTGWSDLKGVVANALEGPQSPSYSNVNLALFRAMLPKMNNLNLFTTNENNMSTGGFENWMSNRYIMIMQDNIFKKIDLQNRGCVALPGQMQMFNEIPNVMKTDVTGDWTNFCGGGGFYLTTKDLSKFIVYLTHSNEFITDSERTLMDNEGLGWRQRPGVTGGTAYMAMVELCSAT